MKRLESKEYKEARTAYLDLQMRQTQARNHRKATYCLPKAKNRKYLSNKERQYQLLLGRIQVFVFNATQRWEKAVKKLNAEDLDKLFAEVHV